MPKDLLDRLNDFEGELKDALVHAVPLDAPAIMPGFPIGPSNDASKSPVGNDLTLMRLKDNRIANKAIGVIGDQGIGKTFLLYVMLYILYAEDYGSGVSGGIEIDSLKHNNAGHPETYPLITTLLGCTVIQVAKTRLNPLNRLWDFTYDEQYRMVKDMLEVKLGSRLDDLALKLLDKYLRVSYHESKEPCFEELSEKIEEYKAPPYYSAAQAAEMELTALRLSAMVGNLTSAEFGKVFGKNSDDEELLRLISQRAKSWDFKGVDQTVRSVIEVFRAAIVMSALQPKDPDDELSGPRFPERVALNLVKDEAYDRWGNPVAADHDFLVMKTLRELDLCYIMAFHRLSDFLRAVGSKKATEVIKEIPQWWIGRQHEADLKDIREFLNPPEYVVKSLTTMNKGTFWLLMPGRAPRSVTVIGTEREIRAFVTNLANEALLKQYLETGDETLYLDWLKETTPLMEELIEVSEGVPHDTITA